MALQPDADPASEPLGGPPLRSYSRGSLRKTSHTSSETASAVASVLAN